MTVPAPVLDEAVAATCAGDEPALRRLLDAHPDLVRERVAKTTVPYDGYFHHATLLHHVSTNPVPERAPANVIAIADLLLRAGSAVDARTSGGPNQPDDPGWTTLGLVASTAEACIGVLRDPLVDRLVAAGADVDDGLGLPLAGALYYGVDRGVAALRRHGARLDLRLAAGVGDVAALARFLVDGQVRPDAIFLSRYGEPPLAAPRTVDEVLTEALVCASLGGQRAAIDWLVAHGADPSRACGGRTPLHAAALHGRDDAIDALLAHGADPFARDARWRATPTGWADHCGHPGCARRLRRAAPGS